MKYNPILWLAKLCWPKPKSRVDVINLKVEEITKELITCGLSSNEIAVAVKTVSADVKHHLEQRKQLLTESLENVTKAINKL